MEKQLESIVLGHMADNSEKKKNIGKIKKHKILRDKCVSAQKAYIQQKN